MSDTPSSATPPGWYHAQGDPDGTARYWDGSAWIGSPQQAGAVGVAAPMGGPGNRDQLAALGLTLAEPWPRIGARLIDGLILIVVAFPIALAVVGSATSTRGVLVAAVFLAIAGVVYEVGMIALKGATLGKMAVGIHVVTVEGLNPPGWGPAILRWVVSLVNIIPVIGGFILLIIWIVSLVFLFSDPRRQTVFDKVAKTYVVRN